MNCIYFLCPDEQSIYKHELDNNHDTEYRDESVKKKNNDSILEEQYVV